MEDFLNNAWKVVVEYWLEIASVSSAILMAIFRTAKTQGKVDWLESFTCGVFSFGVWYALGFFGIPEGLGVLVGGMIGHIGSVKTSSWLIDKLGVDKEDSKDKE